MQQDNEVNAPVGHGYVSNADSTQVVKRTFARCLKATHQRLFFMPPGDGAQPKSGPVHVYKPKRLSLSPEIWGLKCVKEVVEGRSISF